MTVSYDDAVFEELVNISSYIADDNEDAAQRFLDSCDRTFQFLAINRFIGSPGKFDHPELAEVRMWMVKGFEKYLIFYVPTETGVKILHVYHSARDYWRLFELD